MIFLIASWRFAYSKFVTCYKQNMLKSRLPHSIHDDAHLLRREYSLTSLVA